MIGISNDRLSHILAVARQSYMIAKTKYNLDELNCRKAFLLGYLHDVGYEFSETTLEHSEVGYNLIKNSFNIDLSEILNHGNPNINQTLFLSILNEADLTVDSKGNIVSVEDRLNDIKNRYSETAIEYQNPLKVAQKLDLID